MRVIGKPKPTIKWYKEDKHLDVGKNEQYEIVEAEETVSLIIKNCKSDNSGNYYARIENESGAIKTNTAQLTINRMLK
jgi:hypothetical protein